MSGLMGHIELLMGLSAVDPAAPGYITYPVDWVVSMRKRVSTYSGPCLQVQNATTNVLTDISFKSDGWIDEVALAACRTGTQILRVSKWYDQSGHGVDLVMATQSVQPRIITSAGAVDSFAGHPAISFVETLRYLEVATANAVFNPGGAGVNWEVFAGIGTLDTAHFNNMVDSRTTSGAGYSFLMVDNTRKIGFYNGSVFDGAGATSVADNSEHFYAWCHAAASAGSLYQFIDGVLQKTDASVGGVAASTRPLRIGESWELNGSEWPGVIAEVTYTAATLRNTATYTPRSYT